MITSVIYLVAAELSVFMTRKKIYSWLKDVDDFETINVEVENEVLSPVNNMETEEKNVSAINNIKWDL